MRTYYFGTLTPSTPTFDIKLWSSSSTTDVDGDGYGALVDCDDNNTTINPGAQEICDGIDNDCDGLVDEDDPSLAGQNTYFADSDGDGYGNPAVTTQACSAPTGYVSIV